MNHQTHFKNFLNNIIIFIPSVICSYLIFYLLESSLKYIFFSLTFFLIISIYFLIQNKEYVFRYTCPLNISLYIEFMLISVTGSLIILSFFGIKNIYTLFSAAFISFYGLGYFLLRFLRFKILSSKLEFLVLPFWFSISINCILYSILYILNFSSPVIVSFQYLIFMLFLMFVYRKQENESKFEGISIDVDIKKATPLIIIILFFLISIGTTYPNMAQLPGLDIIGHFTSARYIASHNPSFNSPYPWFRFQWASLLLFYDGSEGTFQTTLAYMSVMSILSLYVLTKTYLNDIDERLPILSTIMWGIFSGFGWLHLLSLKLSSEGKYDYIALLSKANNASYLDISYGQGPWIWLWFRPLTLGIMGLFILLYLMKRTDLNLHTSLILLSLSTLSLGLLHFSELVFFIGFLFLLCLIFPHKSFKMKETLISSIIGLFSIIGFSVLYDLVDINVNIPLIYIELLILSLVFSFFAINFKRLFLRKLVLNIDLKHLSRLLIFGFSALWFSLLVYWCSKPNIFMVSLVSSVSGVPLLLYPVLLGVCGMMMFPGAYFLIKKNHQFLILIFVILLTYSIIYGRILTYININYMNAGYWERRIIPITFSASVIISSPFLIKLLDKFYSHKLYQISLLSLIIVSGLTSTVLAVEYRGFIIQNNILTDSELYDIQQLNKLNPESSLLTYSERSRSVSGFTPFARSLESIKAFIWPAKSPELVFNALSSTGRPTVIYLSENDMVKFLKSDSCDGYLGQFFAEVASKIYNKTGTYIFSLPVLSPPVGSSDIVLILPEEKASIFNNIYSVLSIAGYNYTTATIVDVETLSHANTIITPNEDSALKVLKMKDDLGIKIDHLIVINLEGMYGELLNLRNPIDRNVNVISCDIGNLYSFQASSGETVIDYINLFPIISAFEPCEQKMGILANTTKNIIGELASYTFSDEPINSGKVIAFKKVELEGNISISFDSLIIKHNECPNIEVIIDGIVHLFPKNMSTTTAIFDVATLVTNFTEIVPGEGYYLNFDVKDARITLNGVPGSLISFSEKDHQNVLRGDNIILNIKGGQLSLRNPRIYVNGVGRFKSLYTYNDLKKILRTQGDDAQVKGTFTFEGIYGDVFSIANNFDWDGTVESSKNLYAFDEWNSFFQSIPYLLITLPLAIAVYLYDQKQENNIL